MVFLMAVAVPTPLSAEEFVISDPSFAPFAYTVCHAALDANNPGPAAHYGEDVCVDYVAISFAIVRTTDNADGSTDLSWQLFQNGTATVTSESFGDVLYEGPFQASEIAEDRGNDAGCLWSTEQGGDDAHAWLGNCASAAARLDQMNWHLEMYGDTPLFYEVYVSGPGNWCAFDSDGNLFGNGR